MNKDKFEKGYMLLKTLRKIMTIVGLTAFLTSGSLFAEKIEAEIKRSFPGFKFYQKTEGDLNSDGKSDYVAILWNGDGIIDDPASSSWNPEALKALLVIYFNDGKGKFYLQTTAPKAICVGCGGAKAIPGKPLGELNIKNGILWVTYMGGSRAYWTDIFKWRFDKQQKEFLLIGETFSSKDTIGDDPAEYIDINYSTQKAIKRTGNKQEACQIQSPSKENPLSSFDFWAGSVGDRGKILKQCVALPIAQKFPKKAAKPTDKKSPLVKPAKKIIETVATDTKSF